MSRLTVYLTTAVASSKTVQHTQDLTYEIGSCPRRDFNNKLFKSSKKRKSTIRRGISK